MQIAETVKSTAFTNAEFQMWICSWAKPYFFSFLASFQVHLDAHECYEKEKKKKKRLIIVVIPVLKLHDWSFEKAEIRISVFYIHFILAFSTIFSIQWKSEAIDS